MRASLVCIVLLASALVAHAVDEAPAPVPPAPHLRFGIQTPNQHVTWDELLATWKEAETKVMPR